MPVKQQALPFINVRVQENRTPTGQRTCTRAKRAALYYAFGREREAQRQEAQLRGQWVGPDGRLCPHAAVMDWVRTNALKHRYTFQGVLSTPEAALTGVEFGQAMQKGGQTSDWRLISHDDTQNRHAHVLWFGDKRMDKKTFLAWQTAVRNELIRLEQQHAAPSHQVGVELINGIVVNERSVQRQQAGVDVVDPAPAKELDHDDDLSLSSGRGVGLGW